MISTQYKHFSLIHWLLKIAMNERYWKRCLIRKIHRAEIKYSKGMQLAGRSSGSVDKFWSFRFAPQVFIFVSESHDPQINQISSFKFTSKTRGAELRSFWFRLSSKEWSFRGHTGSLALTIRQFALQWNTIVCAELIDKFAARLARTFSRLFRFTFT